MVERHGGQAKRFDDFGLDLDAPPPSLSADDITSSIGEQPSATVQREAEELKFSACLPPAMGASIILQRQFDFEMAGAVLIERR
ncbi:MAG: hypothetical protein ACM31L_07850 [Actinomycetota bacterium]